MSADMSERKPMDDAEREAARDAYHKTKAYAEEDKGRFDTLADYPGMAGKLQATVFLANEYIAILEHSDAYWRERCAALEAALRAFAFTDDELFDTHEFHAEEIIFMRPDDGNDSVQNGWRKIVTVADVRKAAALVNGGDDER